MQNEKYWEIIHLRLNHVQNLQSAMSGLEITGLGIFLAKVNPENLEVLSCNQTLIYGIYGLLLWMHLFTLYQYFSVKKAQLVLNDWENQLKESIGIRYFAMGNMRLRLYFISHAAPTFIAFLAPFLALDLGLISFQTTFSLLGIFFIITIPFFILLQKSFNNYGTI
ncbi:MAG: hypothetical protein A4S08_09795 [Proteobacteria bacterium SG_bin4]|nr:MAG: hypothetical protein A4S08_09795 [Proteobacteria bacterium SG_bin4]